MRDIFIPEGTQYNGTPRLVVQATNLFLELHQQGALTSQSDRDLAKDYLQRYTFPLLESASRGGGRVFGLAGVNKRFIMNTQSVDLNEAADYANVVFAWMHEMYASPYLPMGFSRRGILQAPQTLEEFEGRIREMRKELMLLVAGMRDPAKALEAIPSALRAHAFFRVGSLISDKLPTTEREMEAERKELAQELTAKRPEFIETAERRRINALLEGIHIDLSTDGQ